MNEVKANQGNKNLSRLILLIPALLLLSLFNEVIKFGRKVRVDKPKHQPNENDIRDEKCQKEFMY